MLSKKGYLCLREIRSNDNMRIQRICRQIPFLANANQPPIDTENDAKYQKKTDGDKETNTKETTSDPLSSPYPGHIRTTLLQKGMKVQATYHEKYYEIFCIVIVIFKFTSFYYILHNILQLKEFYLAEVL